MQRLIECKEQLWQDFQSSGKIQDYILYSELCDLIKEYKEFTK